jgi:DNA mismatch repair ATPase MutL
VTFTLRHDGKEVWVMPSSANEAERLAMVFGRDAARALLPLDGAAARLLDGRLRGFRQCPGNDRLIGGCSCSS